MSKPLKVIAIVAGVVAFAASVAVTFGATAFLGASLATIAGVASAVSAAASMGAAALQKPPDMRGTVSQIMIGANMPIIYAMGLTYIGGGLIHDSSAGEKNRDRTQFIVGSAAGPIEEFQAFQADYSTISFSGSDWNTSREATGFYNDYLWLNTRKGLRPDTALTQPSGRASFNGWGSSHRTSGFASWSVTMKFDKDGKRWASGIPQWGMIAKWVKVYDPRLDSTYPGGSGSHLWDDESTWTWSDNPGLHALTYARGRFINGVKIVGPGIAAESIDIPAFVELANICDANGWVLGGAVYEGPGLSKWDNLKRILQAAASEPVWVGGVLTVKVSAPKISLDTITSDDLADGEVEVRAMGSWKDRYNSLVPRYRSSAHRWEYVQGAAVTNATYVTEDGETKTDEIQFDLVQNVTQATELAAYVLTNRREFGPIRLNVKPRLILYRPGDALTLDIPEAGLVNELCVITGRTVDPASGSIQLTLESETTAKHAYALGQTGEAPPTPTIITPEEADDLLSTIDPALVAATSWMPDIAPVTIYADHTGTVSDGQLPRNVAATRMNGATDVTALSDWSFTVDSGGITATIGAATGILNITALASSSVVTITSVYNEVTLSKKVSILKSVADAPVGGGGESTATDTSFASINSTTLAPISDELTVVVGVSGEVELSANLYVSTDAVAPTGAFQIEAKWQWWDGAAWADVGPLVPSVPECVVELSGGSYFVYDGAVTVSQIKDSLTFSASEKFRLVAANSPGTRTMYFSGSASAVAS